MKSCFIISPIGEEGSPVRRHADAVYRYIIKPAMEEVGIEAIRADHLSEPGMISEQTVKHILGDDLCIALLTGHNPNVFFELGVAHAADRPVVILTQKGETLPFDVKDFRCVHYDLDPEKVPSYRHDVAKQVRAAASAAPRVRKTELSDRSARPTEADARAQDLLYTLNQQPGSDFASLTTDAVRISILGRTFTSLLTRYEKNFVQLLSSGCDVRLMFVDPGSQAAGLAYGSDPDVYRQNLQVARTHMKKLHEVAPSSLVTKVISQPPPLGMMIVENRDSSRNSLRVQLHFLGSCTGRDRPIIPVFADDPWYTVFAKEFEELWMRARPWEPSESDGRPKASSLEAHRA